MNHVATNQFLEITLGSFRFPKYLYLTPKCDNVRIGIGREGSNLLYPSHTTGHAGLHPAVRLSMTEGIVNHLLRVVFVPDFPFLPVTTFTPDAFLRPSVFLPRPSQSCWFSAAQSCPLSFLHNFSSVLPFAL